MRFPIAVWIWLIFVVYAIVRIPTAAVPREALWTVLQLVGAAFTFFIFYQTAGFTSSRTWLITCVLLVMSLLCWYAIILHIRGEAVVLWQPRPVQYGMRASSTYICPNHFAAHMALVACLALGVLMSASFGAGVKIIAGYTLLLILPSLLLTGSRSGFLGLVAGLSVTIWLHMLRKSWKAAFLSALGILGTGVAIVIVLWFTVPSIQARIYGSMLSNPDPAVSSRLMIWADSLRMFRDQPWFGFGPGSFRWVHPTYKEIFAQVRWRFAHNEYLHLLTEYGLVGALLMLTSGGGYIIWLMRRTYKTADSFGAAMGAVLCGALFASLIHALFDYNLHVYPVVQVLAMLAGVTTAALVPVAAGPSSKTAGRIQAGGVCVLALAVLLVTSVVYAADIYSKKGDKWAEQLKRDQAEVYYNKAIRLQPNNDQIWFKLGEGHRFKSFWNRDPVVQKQEADKAFEAYDRTLQYNPYEFGALIGKGRLLCHQGHDEEGLALMREAYERVPTQGPFIEQYGLQLRRSGYTKEAYQLFDEAMRKGIRTETVKLNHAALKNELAKQKQ